MDNELASRLLHQAEMAEKEMLKEGEDKNQQYIFEVMKELPVKIKTLERQLSDMENSGTADTKTAEDKLIDIKNKYHALKALQRGDKKEALSRSRNMLLGNEQGTLFAPASEYPDPSTLEGDHVLMLQQRIMDEQDQSLDHLSVSIGRQRELGIMIGDELDVHAQLIDETDTLVQQTDRRLQQAQKKLRYVGRKVKDNKSICIVIALIIVFFVLVALFR